MLSGMAGRRPGPRHQPAQVRLLAVRIGLRKRRGTITKLAAAEVAALDPYMFMAIIGKTVIHPGGRASTQALLPAPAAPSSVLSRPYRLGPPAHGRALVR